MIDCNELIPNAGTLACGAGEFNFGDESQKKGYIIDCKNIYLFI